MIKCKKLPVIAIKTVLTRATNSNLRQAGLPVINTLNAITLAQLYPRLYLKTASNLHNSSSWEKTNWMKGGKYLTVCLREQTG